MDSKSYVSRRQWYVSKWTGSDLGEGGVMSQNGQEVTVREANKTKLLHFTAI